MGTIQLIGGKLKNGHYVDDTGPIHQLENPLSCNSNRDTFIKSKCDINGGLRNVYMYIGVYPLGVAYGDLPEDVKNRPIASVTTKTTLIK